MLKLVERIVKKMFVQFILFSSTKNIPLTVKLIYKKD